MSTVRRGGDESITDEAEPGVAREVVDQIEFLTHLGLVVLGTAEPVCVNIAPQLGECRKVIGGGRSEPWFGHVFSQR